MSLSVVAAGTPPLAYQWQFNGTNIGGATDSVLMLTNIQLAQAGIYAAQVTNAYGSTISSNAVLTVDQGPPCVTPPSGLVAWWPGEGNAHDIVGTNNGTLSGAVTFAPGRVGQCFAFTGVGYGVDLPDAPALALTNSLTIECWLFVTNAPSGVQVVIFRGDTRPGFDPYAMTVIPGASGSTVVQFGVTDPSNNSAGIGSPIPTGTWTHVTTTLDDATRLLTIYTNAVVAIQITTTIRPLGPLNPNYNPGVGIGNFNSHMAPYNYPFRGRIDELCLYSRALSVTEIQALYNAGSAGKCSGGTAPSITTQPAGQTALAGSSATFTVTAECTPPPNYQWRFNGTNLLNATNAAYAIQAVGATNTGNYCVVVTNSLGSVTSSNALLTVIVPPTLAFQLLQGYPLLNLSGMLSSNFVVQYSTNLGGTNWVTLLSLTNLSSSPYPYLDIGGVGQPARFYRAFMR